MALYDVLEPGYLIQLGISIALGAFVFLLTWRLAAASADEIRDSAYMEMFPEWGYYAPGIAPMLAISVAYVLMGVAGHGLMRLISGPAEAGLLTRLLCKPA